MVLIKELVANLLKRHVDEDGSAGCFFDDGNWVMKSQKERSECLWADGAKAKSTFSSYLWILFFGDSFNEHELSMCSKVFNTENCTFSHTSWFILETFIKERQQIPWLEISIEMWPVKRNVAETIAPRLTITTIWFSIIKIILWLLGL